MTTTGLCFLKFVLLDWEVETNNDPPADASSIVAALYKQPTSFLIFWLCPCFLVCSTAEIHLYV